MPIASNLKATQNSLPKEVTLVAISKTKPNTAILEAYLAGQRVFGENKVQEGKEKWHELKIKFDNVKLHMIGKLQTNKVRDCVKYFDFIHSVDNKKLAKKIHDEQKKINKKLKIFVQVNIGEENQKSGITKDKLDELIKYCKEINLDVIGLMCIPPANTDPISYFTEMEELTNNLDFKELSMGMSSDYLKASEYSSTYLRIGSSIFGQRS